MQRLETEAKTLMKLLAVETKNMWPPVIDNIKVAKGYEMALGAALGDDLDAPVDPSSRDALDGRRDRSDRSAAAGGRRAAVAAMSRRRRNCARRLAQIGVVDRADGARLAAQLKPGQRLVSRDGDLWRWDGFAADAHAPTGAARRLAERSRLADIDAELVAAPRRGRARAQGRGNRADGADRRGGGRNQRPRAAARGATRGGRRPRTARRGRARNRAQRGARVRAERSEGAPDRRPRRGAGGGARGAQALVALPPSADIEGQLAAVRSEIEGHRAALAEVRAEAQALAREAELADRRLGAIATERAAWSERRDGAVAQIATLDARSREASAEHATLADAPAMFAEKRRALISEIEAAETTRGAAADRLAEAESALAAADRAVRAALEALGLAREEAARSAERVEGAKRRLADIAHEIREMLEVEPDGVAALAGIEPGATLADVASHRGRT